jgi:hypothetical protein
LRKEDQNKLYYVAKDYISQQTLTNKNRGRAWVYGYNEQYEVIVISKTGQIGEIINIAGLYIALPPTPSDCHKRSDTSSEQYWERQPVPKELEKIPSIFNWNEKPAEFKNKWVDYIEKEFDYREQGFWFYNNGKPCYITGSHYMYLQWSSIDVGYPDFREANRILFLFWEACKAD